jgi:hypothetical protein
MYRWLFLLIGLSFYSIASAQEINDTSTYYRDQQNYIIKKTNGDQLEGKLLLQRRDYILIALEDNTQHRIVRDSIKSISVSALNKKKVSIKSDIIKYNIWNAAFTLNKGQVYFRTVSLLSQTFHYGITDKIMVGAGVSFLSVLAGEPLIFLSTKINAIRTGYFNLSVAYDASIPTVYGGLDNVQYPFVGLASSSFTLGRSRDNFTFGLGLLQVENEFSETLFYALGGHKSLSEKVSLIADGFFSGFEQETFFVANFGVRIRAKKHSWEIYLFLFGSSELVYPVGFPSANYILEIN